VAAFGEPLDPPLGAVTHLFPTAEALAAADPARLPLPASRRVALQVLCRALASGALVLDGGADRDDARRTLAALPGIGPWTIEYLALRALRDPDAFPATDLGIRRAVEGLGGDGRPAAVEARSSAWRPYRAYAVIHLWSHLAPRSRAAA
jgi:AraC family transcriptional regulator of adaptative response / DNA-3-methyladenine glycosylase II